MRIKMTPQPRLQREGRAWVASRSAYPEVVGDWRFKSGKTIEYANAPKDMKGAEPICDTEGIWWWADVVIAPELAMPSADPVIG